MNISIIIPVYNEASQLDACLRAIALQTVAPLEVIVVDNNSTDNSVAVAESYSFVRLLHESKQGVVHARTRGFNAARGDILGRIDADTIMPDDWVATLKEIFSNKNVDATSGIAGYYNLAAAGIFNAGDLRMRRYLAKYLKNTMYLWGANMAVRKTAWNLICNEVCYKNGIHEDYDIALHLQKHGGVVTFDERLKVAVSSRRIDVGCLEFLRYTMTSSRTYSQHGIAHDWLWRSVTLSAAITYVPGHIMHRGYDAALHRFTLRKLFSPKTTIPRVDPTTNVA